MLKRTAIGAVLAIASISISAPCTLAFGSEASAPETSVSAEIPYVTVVGTENLEGSSSGSSETNTTSSSGSSRSQTNMSLEDARGIYHDVRDSLLDYISQMEGSITADDGLLKVQIAGNNPVSATNISFISVPLGEMASLASNALSINQYLGDSDAAAFNRETKGAAMTEADIPTVTDALTDTTVSYGDNEDYDIMGYWNLVADDAGLCITQLPSMYNIYDYTTGGYSHAIAWNPDDLLTGLPSYYYYWLSGAGSSSYNDRLSIGGFRTDLLSGGFYDADTWAGRFAPYSGLSNSMEDNIILGLIEEYRISSITENVLDSIAYAGDLRLWIVTDVETGEEILRTETNNAEHELSLANPGAGTYVITEYQYATYTNSTYVTYVKMQYLFDANTKNLLYFNEAATTDEVCVGQTSEQGYIPTSSVTVRVNDLGDIEGSGSGVERVE